MTGWFFLNRNFVIYWFIGAPYIGSQPPSRSTTRALQYIGLMGLWSQPIQQPTRGWQNHKRVTSQIGLRIGKIKQLISFHEISGILWLLPELVVVYPCDCWILWLWHWKYEAYFWDWKAGQLIFTTEKNKHTFAKRGQPDILFLAKDVVFFSPPKCWQVSWKAWCLLVRKAHQILLAKWMFSASSMFVRSHIHDLEYCRGIQHWSKQTVVWNQLKARFLSGKFLRFVFQLVHWN